MRINALIKKSGFPTSSFGSGSREREMAGYSSKVQDLGWGKGKARLSHIKSGRTTSNNRIKDSKALVS